MMKSATDNAVTSTYSILWIGVELCHIAVYVHFSLQKVSIIIHI